MCGSGHPSRYLLPNNLGQKGQRRLRPVLPSFLDVLRSFSFFALSSFRFVTIISMSLPTLFGCSNVVMKVSSRCPRKGVTGPKKNRPSAPPIGVIGFTLYNTSNAASSKPYFDMTSKAFTIILSSSSGATSSKILISSSPRVLLHLCDGFFKNVEGYFGLLLGYH